MRATRPCRSRRIFVTLFALAAAAPLLPALAADETSSGDKLRILYSNRFTFTRDGLPLVTVAIMEGQRSVSLASRGGLVVKPDGDGGSELRAGDRWTVTLEHAKSGRYREWTVVERLGADDGKGAQRAAALWKKRGFSVREFEVGALFAVDGDVVDSRKVLIAIAPVAATKGEARAREIGERYGIATEVHVELLRRPEATIVAQSGELEIRNSSVLWFSPERAGGTVDVDNVLSGQGGSQLTTSREKRSYFGSVYVTVGRDGKLAVANAVAANELLAGLVPSEMYPEAPIEALKAQAIAARTDLLGKIGTRHLGDPFLLCSTQHCQVYSGAGKEHRRTTEAVRATRGQVLLRDGGGLADARYSAACGGHTENNDAIWGGAADPALRGHRDAARPSGAAIDGETVDAFLVEGSGAAYCGATRYSAGRYRWNATMSAAELDRLVAARFPELGSVRAIEPMTRGVSGRILSLRLRGTSAERIVHGELAIRRLFGGLRSSLFTLRVKEVGGVPASYHFRGAGFGHGVGMCQLGAIAMAEGGRLAAEILAHYFRGARPQRLY